MSDTGTRALFEQCEALFEDYPLAVDPVTDDGTQSSVALMQADVPAPQFYILHHVSDGEPCPFFVLRPWRSAGGVKISADGSSDAPALTAEVLGCVVPLPRDGSLFGYAVGEKVTALLPFSGASGEEDLMPSWAVMPRIGEHRDLWPVFTGESLFGGWFWQQHREGRILDLGPAIAASPGAVLWADTAESLGADCCAVTRDLQAGDATLPVGVYAYHELLRDCIPVPPLDVLLAAYSTVDLAPRFKEMAS